jgi:prepilin-type N-terminal cleavage/methylation domain-containing protein
MNVTSRQAPQRGGFTLLEVMVAVVVLTVGLMGLAGATTYVLRQVNVSELKTERSLAKQTALERIRAAGHGQLLEGVDTVGDYIVKWSSEQPTPHLQRVRLVSVGPGLSRTDGGVAMMSNTVADTTTYAVVKR